MLRLRMTFQRPFEDLETAFLEAFEEPSKTL